MSVDLRCDNCGDNLGKDVENPKDAWCGTCGSPVYNERGYDEEEDEADEKGSEDN